MDSSDRAESVSYRPRKYADAHRSHAWSVGVIGVVESVVMACFYDRCDAYRADLILRDARLRESSDDQFIGDDADFHGTDERSNNGSGSVFHGRSITNCRGLACAHANEPR